MTNEMRKKIRNNILKFGQHVVLVQASEGDPADFLPFVYTIGNHEAGLPELLLIGAADGVYGRILNIVGDIQRERGTPFQFGELVDFTAALPARIIDAGQRGRDEYAVQAGVYYRRDDIAIQQVLLPDQNGKYPGEAGCQPPYCDQPLLTMIH
jgi:hypothetical protein